MTTKKTAFITGTSTGMGRELVLQLAGRGWNVAATMRDVSKADPRFLQLPNVRVYEVDVTEPATINRAVDGTTSEWGAIDLLVNNAGFAQRGTLEEVSLARWRSQYETNVFGVVNVLDAVLPGMRQRRSGHIMNVSSMGGHVSLPTMTVYTSSKFALEGLTEGLAKELAPLGIKVTLIEPAGMDTAFLPNAEDTAELLPDYEGARAAMREFSASSRWGNVERGMSAVADLADIDNPPLRFAVGSYGLEMVRGKVQELLAEYGTWEELTLSTD